MASHGARRVRLLSLHRSESLFAKVVAVAGGRICIAWRAYACAHVPFCGYTPDVWPHASWLHEHVLHLPRLHDAVWHVRHGGMLTPMLMRTSSVCSLRAYTAAYPWIYRSIAFAHAFFFCSCQ